MLYLVWTSCSVYNRVGGECSTWCGHPVVYIIGWVVNVEITCVFVVVLV